jgi:tetratricopeptide (TPR) repeat protein
MRTRLAIAAALLLAWATAGTASAFDEIRVARMATGLLRGTIVQMSPTEITLEQSGVRRAIPVNDVVDVQFEDDPLDLRSARRSIEAGQNEDALDRLNAIKPETLGRDFIKQDVAFYKAYAQARKALAGGGDRSAAAIAMNQFKTSYPNSYHYYEAVQVLGDLGVALGNYARAAEFYAEIAKAPWPDYQLRATVQEARALQHQQQYAAALAKYDAVLGTTDRSPSAEKQRNFALVGKAACLGESGKPEDGIRLAEQIIAEGDAQDTSLFARAYNALGTCQRKANRPKEALLAYLHVDILFYGDGEAHAEALYHLNQLWTEVNNSERAIRARTLLKERYPGSVWNGRLAGG